MKRLLSGTFVFGRARALAVASILAMAMELVLGGTLTSLCPVWAWKPPVPGYWVPLPAATIVFPKDSIGKYLVQQTFRTTIDYYTRDCAGGRAAGLLHKPANTALRLEVFYDRSDKLKKLETLKPDDIQILDLRGAEDVKDEDLKHAAKLTGLVEIDLTDTDIGDAGVHELTAIKNLRAVTIRNTEMTNNGVKELIKLPNLKGLCIAANQKIDDTGAAYVTEMKGVISLDIGYTSMKDKGIDEIISKMPQLLSLTCDDVRFSDNALRHVAGLSKLQKLSMVNAKVTDASIPSLKKLKALVSLDIRGTKITTRGLRELKQALPSCEVKVGQQDLPFMRP